MAVIDPKIYGRDLFLESGDLQVSNTGDLQQIVSLDNVGQAIKNFLLTEKGTLFYSRNYGINMLGLLGSKNIPLVITLLRDEINKILQDYRIESIENLIIAQDADNPSRLNINLIVKPIESMETIDVSLSYPFTNTQLPTSSLTSEVAVSTSQVSVSTVYSIYSISGVWLATDTEIIGINYFTGGFINYNNISLGTPLPSEKTKVIIDYTTPNVVKNTTLYQIFSEAIYCTDGRNMLTKYNIQSIAGIWLASDTFKTDNLVDNVEFANKSIRWNIPVSLNSSYIIDYSTYDIITN